MSEVQVGQNINSGRKPSTAHQNALDGARGIAILLVLAIHLEANGAFTGTRPLVSWFRRLMYTGWVGVDLFFVLSGFLITGILLDTKYSPNRLSSFYARRALRIFPLYYFMIALTVMLSLKFQGMAKVSPSPIGWLSYVTYLQNWYMPVHEPNQVILGHFWSLGVEEQFYLVWPAIVWMVSQKRLIWICACGCVVALALRVALNQPSISPVILMNTCTRLDTLLCGAFCAIAVRDPKLLVHVRRAIPYVAAVSTLGMIYIDFFAQELKDRSAYTQTIGFTFLAFGFSALILSAYLQNGSGTILDRLLCFLPLRLLGKYSYGIYIYHILVFTVFFSLSHWRGWLFASSMVLSTFVVAAISYEFFEKRFLRLKSRFRAIKQLPPVRDGVPA